MVVGKMVEGDVKRFIEPTTFHEGPGTVVECPLSGKDSLLEDCKGPASIWCESMRKGVKYMELSGISTSRKPHHIAR